MRFRPFSGAALSDILARDVTFTGDLTLGSGKAITLEGGMSTSSMKEEIATWWVPPPAHALYSQPVAEKGTCLHPEACGSESPPAEPEALKTVNRSKR